MTLLSGYDASVEANDEASVLSFAPYTRISHQHLANVVAKVTVIKMESYNYSSATNSLLAVGNELIRASLHGPT